MPVSQKAVNSNHNMKQKSGLKQNIILIILTNLSISLKATARTIELA